MSGNTLQIRSVRFIGPNKKPAEITFGPGLNLIYGPSNTGKSSVLDAIDFMLGREWKLKEIPEHEGYAQVVLGIEFSNNQKYSLVRSIAGGDFKLYAGLQKQEPNDQDGVILRAKNPTKKISTVSDFLLKQLAFDGKKLKKKC